MFFFRKKDVVKYVKNTNLKFKTESAEYLLVKGYKQDPLLFTLSEVERAKKRAVKNPEDTQ
tara:strand:+ start:688 stop:870 length:183 start_codon:yes stop_codon:yes gene_type:complete